MKKTKTGPNHGMMHRPGCRHEAKGTSAFIALTQLGGPLAPAVRPSPKDGPPCQLCPARCCNYFALHVDTPVTPEDHDYVRWFLMHEHVVVWRQDGDWYLEVRTRCKNLQPDNRCGIYDTRPQICREYGLPDPKNPEAPCEFFTDDTGYELFFDSAETFGTWSKAELAKREQRLAKRRQQDRGRRSSRGGPARREATV